MTHPRMHDRHQGKQPNATSERTPSEARARLSLGLTCNVGRPSGRRRRAQRVPQCWDTRRRNAITLLGGTAPTSVVGAGRHLLAETTRGSILCRDDGMPTFGAPRLRAAPAAACLGPRNRPRGGGRWDLFDGFVGSLVERPWSAATRAPWQQLGLAVIAPWVREGPRRQPTRPPSMASRRPRVIHHAGRTTPDA